MSNLARRSLATKLSRHLSQNDNNESMEVYRSTMHFPHFNMMRPQNHLLSKNAIIQNLIPIAYCDSSDKIFFFSLNKMMFSLMHFIPKSWTKKNYDAILENKDKAALLEAYENCLLDFNYVPKMKRFYRNLLDMGPEVNDILVQYFESGSFEKMRKEGKLDYLKVMNSAVKRKNYFIALIALKHEIEYAKNDPAFISHTKFNPSDLYKYGMVHLENFDEKKIVYDYLSKDEIDMFEFYALLQKHGDIFPLKHYKVAKFMKLKAIGLI
jgi:hypothetical protein